MEIPITNLRAEKGTNGKIYVLFSDDRLSQYELCIACIEQNVFAEWTNAEGIHKKALFHG